MCGIIKFIKLIFFIKVIVVFVKKIIDKIVIVLISFVCCFKLIEIFLFNERMVIDFDINNVKIILIILNGIVILMILGFIWFNFVLN